MQISTYERDTQERSDESISTNSSHLIESIHLPLYSNLLSYDPEWHAAASLASVYGYSSLTSFALDQKKQLFFSKTGKAFISYVLRGNVALVIGDPIGPDQELSLVLAEFLAFWRARHKAVAFWQVREELLDLYHSQKLHALKIGEDTIIDVQNFSLKGGKIANVRTSARRAEKSNMSVIFYKGAITSTTHREQMTCISQMWLAQKGGHEMGFSMGRFEPEAEAERITAIAIDQDENVHAFLTFLPIYGRNGWSLDLLRRSEQTIPGTMELLLVRSLEYFKARGDAMMSLGMAPLNNDNQSQLSPLNRWCTLLLRHSRTFHHFHTLTAFKRKFQPAWENRYLIYSHPFSLVQIALALNAVHQQPD